MKFFHDIKEETLITIAVAYVAFITAELFQLSGIFAIITAMILFKTFIDKDITEEQRLSLSKDGTLTKKLRGLKKIATTKAKHDITLSNLENYAYLATVVVFVSLASLINVYSLFTYWKDILIVFVATTIIRGIVMAKFLFLGKTTKAIDYVGFSGWVILTLAGMKGALSIVMVHALPKNFIFLEKFEAITVGVVILSIFVYGLGLLWYMINQEKKKLN
jgi:CPA1 family monovalent cation:H+ antiporter